MAPTFKVALIQLYPKPLDPANNFARASAFITSAAEAGASLAVLPEYHLTGWVPSDPNFAVLCSQWESYLTKYQDLAKSLKINIVPGTIVQASWPSSDSVDARSEEEEEEEQQQQHQHNENGGSNNNTNGHTTTKNNNSNKNEAQPTTPTPAPTLINVSTFISYTGEILGSYTKKNLWHPERPHLTPSTRSETHDVIETPLGPLGLLVCWDLAFPEAFRSLILLGAKIIIIPTFWMSTDCSPEGAARNPDAEALFLRATLVARAYENTACVIFVNAGGKKEEGYLGLSQVAMPFVGAVKGSLVEGGGCEEEGMGVVEVDMEILEEAERNYKVREDLARADWHYGYSHEVVEEEEVH